MLIGARPLGQGTMSGSSRRPWGGANRIVGAALYIMYFSAVRIYFCPSLKLKGGVAMARRMGRPEDATHLHIKTWNEEFEKDGVTKTRKIWECNYCGLKKVFSSIGRCCKHLTGSEDICKGNGGVGAYPRVPPHVKTQFLASVNAKLDDARRATRPRARARQYPWPMSHDLRPMTARLRENFGRPTTMF